MIVNRSVGTSRVADAITSGRSRWLLLTILFAGFTFFPELAAARVLPDSRDEIRLSFAGLAARTGPAVVNVYAETRTTRRSISPLFDDPFFRRFFGNLPFGRSERKPRQTLGSGVILDPGGLVVTNHHVIENATDIRVVLSDRREFDAELLIADERTDLAVLAIDSDSEDLPYLEMRDSDSVLVGDLVLAIGNPFGVGQTVTSGIVSALARTASGISDYSFFIQTDAAINPGNSGGALIAMDGRLIGVNTAIYSKGGGSVGIGFAVPSNMVRTVLQSARGGRLVRPWIGATGQTVTADLAGEFGLDRPGGVVINAVYPGGPAEKAGLRIGDVVLSIDEKPIADLSGLAYRIATTPIGSTATMSIMRRGERMDLTLALREPLSAPEPDITDIDGRNPLAGARVANLSPAFALENGLNDLARGVVVLGVRRGSAAAEFGLRKGDLIVEVNGRRIMGTSDLRGAVASRDSIWRIAVRRDGRVHRILVRD